VIVLLRSKRWVTSVVAAMTLSCRFGSPLGPQFHRR
jgi:hypothetical protein